MQSTNKRIFMMFLVLFPAALILGTLITNVQGGPYIPEPHANNKWHWSVDVGDKMYFETEFILTNVSTREVEMMFKDIWIYNITSIANVTLDWLGVNDFSQVNASMCYYNVTEGELESYGYSSEFALFGYENSTDPIKHRIKAGQNGIPLLLPLNGSNNVQVDIMADIINETLYYPMGQTGFNKYDGVMNDTISNRIYFTNSTDGFYSDAYYYDNGTLNMGSAYMMAQFGGGPLYINATMKQVFNYNITDDLTWGVNPGDDIYYDGVENERFFEEYSMELKIHINSISDILINKTKNGFSEEPIYMVYEAVFADLLIWNGTDYEIMYSDIPIGMANNFYTQYFDETGPSPYNFLYPTNFVREDYEFMWNNDTLRIWDLPFDEVQFYDNGVLEVVVRNSTGIGLVNTKIEKSSGIVQSMFMLDEHGFMYFEIKTQTLVDWSLNLGNVFYYKANGEEFYDIKATIVGTYACFTNMTYVSEYYNYYGIPLILPSGQPELQFFSYIEASFEEWDPNTESWTNYHEMIIAMANIYWPISPIMLEVGSPSMLVPENTYNTDLSYFFDMYSPDYDSITYNTGHVTLRNSTLDKEMHYYFDETSGLVTMMYGWGKIPVPGAEWTYMSYYPK